MEHEREYIDQLIASYLSGELDEQQTCELKSWIAGAVEHEKYFMRYQEIWFSSCSEEETRIYDSDKAIQRFKNRVSKYGKKSGRSYWARFRNVYKYAAAVFIVGVASYVSFQAGEENLYDALSMIVMDAPAGGTSRMVLPDGTVVVLNGGSKLAYAQSFGVKDRSVELEGEAYFEVTKNGAKPFCVESQGIRVNVLGTKFNVQNYPEDKMASVSLMEGKVALDNKLNTSQHIVLIPGERAEFDKETGILNKMKIKSIADDNSWMDGEMIFEELPLLDVAKLLSRSYGVDISIRNDALKSLRIVGRFNRNTQSVNEVMSVLEATGKIRYDIQGKSITIY